eukprot:8421264-Pyramimonas_sp.AAC.1
MVYVPPEDLGWRPYAERWLTSLAPKLKMSDEQRDHLWQLFEDYVDQFLTFVRTECKEAIPSVDINLVTSLTMLLQGLLTQERGLDLETPPEVRERKPSPRPP